MKDAAELAPIEGLDHNILTLCTDLNAATYELLVHEGGFRNVRTAVDADIWRKTMAAKTESYEQPLTRWHGFVRPSHWVARCSISRGCVACLMSPVSLRPKTK